jgi:hypothetical protein
MLKSDKQRCQLTGAQKLIVFNDWAQNPFKFYELLRIYDFLFN